MSRIAIALLAIVSVACGDDGEPLQPDGPPVPTLFRPGPGEFYNWDVQLRDPIDLSQQRAMYVLELFDVVPAARTLNYPNGPVTFPAGKLPTAIADLQAAGTIVVCRVGTGAIRLGDPDASQYPGFEASPPDNPTPPAADSVIGWSTLDPNAPDERFLDIRSGARSVVMMLLQQRFALAKQIGCDAIDADKTFVVGLMTGFDPAATPDEITAFNIDVAGIAHDSGSAISVGLHNGFFIAADPEIMDAYEFQIMEGVAANQDCCDELRPFLDRGKAAFVIDRMSVIGVDDACREYEAGNMRDGLIKDDVYSSAFRADCGPP